MQPAPVVHLVHRCPVVLVLHRCATAGPRDHRHCMDCGGCQHPTVCRVRVVPSPGGGGGEARACQQRSSCAACSCRDVKRSQRPPVGACCVRRREWQRDEWDDRVREAHSILRHRYVPVFEVFGVDLVVSAHPTLYVAALAPVAAGYVHGHSRGCVRVFQVSPRRTEWCQVRCPINVQLRTTGCWLTRCHCECAMLCAGTSSQVAAGHKARQ